MKEYVTYKRVSTKKQGESGLGLEAQEEALSRWLKGKTIIAEFVEIESGKNDERPELAKAVNLCKERGAILAFSKLDRLGRDASFLHQIRKEIEILDVESPSESTLLFAVKAGMAQEEREKISSRTKDALRAKKESEGAWINNPEGIGLDKAIEASVAARKAKAEANDNNRRALALIRMMMLDRAPKWDEVASELNYWGFRTSTNKLFSRGTAFSLWSRRYDFEYFKD